MASRPAIPIAVRQQLRKEVGYGCPECRKPFLEFHHFDPPWEVEQHFRVEGMIALCPECHRAASHWGKEKCRQLKDKDYSKHVVKGFFNSWSQPVKMLVCVGGNYSLGTKVPVAVGNEDVITLSADEVTGNFHLSFVLRNRLGVVIAQMEDDSFVVTPSDLHDMHTTVTKHELKVWVDSENVGVDIRFEWLKWDRFVARWKKERGKGSIAGKLREKIRRESLEMGLGSFMDAYLEAADEMPAEVEEALKDCLVNGKLPLLDVREMTVYRNGVKTVFKDGVVNGKSQIVGCFSLNVEGTGIRLAAYEVDVLRANGSRYGFSNGISGDCLVGNNFMGDSFSDQVIVVDGKNFGDCKFSRCHLVYKGGAIPKFNGCQIDDCLWVFDEGARGTIEMLHLLYHRFGACSQQMIEELFEDVRNSPIKVSGVVPATSAPSSE